MSDLADRHRDLASPPNTRITAGNRLRRDPRRRVSDLVLAGLLLAAACARPPPTKIDAAPVQRAEIWVDAFSTTGGDGTLQRPLKTLPSPIPPDTTVQVRAGLYAGPFFVPEGAVIAGHGEVVLTSEGRGVTVTATGATLKGLTIQGGATGLEARDVTLEQVRFSGQREAAVRASGAVTLKKCALDATIEGIDGVLARDAQLTLEDVRFTGGFRRGIDVSGGQLQLTGVRFEGAKTSVRALDAVSTLTKLEAGGGSSTALLFAGGSLTATKVDVIGHEYGLQLTRGIVATVRDFTSAGALQAGLSSEQQTRLTLDRARIARSGPSGGLMLLDSVSDVRNLTVSGGRDLGVLVRKGEATLARVDVSGIDGGDALHVRDAMVTVTDAIARDCGGSGLFVSAAARVTGDGLQVDRAAQSAVLVELGATLKLESLLVRGGGGPAVLVPSAATVQLGTLSVSGGSEQPVYAECEAGARVSVQRLESTVEALPSRCVDVKR